MKNKTMGGLSVAVMMLLNSSQIEAHKITRAKGPKNPDVAKDNALVDMGQKLSNLSLSMLSKEESNQNKEPSNDEMVQIHEDLYLNTFEQIFAKVFQKNRGDDVDNNDIMAYSALGGADASNDDELAFGAGGAIMEALAQSNPELVKQDKPKPSPKPKTKAKRSVQKKIQSQIPSSSQSLASIISDSIGGPSLFDADNSPPVQAPVEQVENVQNKKEDFMDGVLESTLTNKKNFGTTRHLDSLEQERASEDAAWGEIAKQEKLSQMKKEKEQADAAAAKAQEDSAQWQEKEDETEKAAELKTIETKPKPVIPKKLSEQNVKKAIDQDILKKTKNLIKQKKIQALLQKKKHAAILKKKKEAEIKKKAEAALKAIRLAKKAKEQQKVLSQQPLSILPVQDISSQMSANLGNGNQFRYESPISDTKAPASRSSLDEAAALLSATQRQAKKAGVNYEAPVIPSQSQQQSIVQQVIAKAKQAAKSSQSMYTDSAKLLASASTLGSGSPLDISPPAPQTEQQQLDDKTKFAIEKTLSVAKANQQMSEPVKPEPTPQLSTLSLASKLLGVAAPSHTAPLDPPSPAVIEPVLPAKPLPNPTVSLPTIPTNPISSFLTTKASTMTQAKSTQKESLTESIMKQIDAKLNANSNEKISGSAQKAAHTDLSSAIIDSMQKAANNSESKKPDASEGLKGQNLSIIDSLKNAANLAQKKDTKSEKTIQSLTQQKAESATEKSIKITMKQIDPNESKKPKDSKKAIQPPHSLSHQDVNEESMKQKNEREGSQKHDALKKQMDSNKKQAKNPKKSEKQVIKLAKKSMADLNKQNKEDKKKVEQPNKTEPKKEGEKHETSKKESKPSALQKKDEKPVKSPEKKVDKKESSEKPKQATKSEPKVETKENKEKKEDTKIEPKKEVKPQSLMQKSDQNKDQSDKKEAVKSETSTPTTTKTSSQKENSQDKVKEAKKKIQEKKTAVQKPKKDKKLAHAKKTKSVAQQKIEEARKKIAQKKAEKAKPQTQDEIIDQVYDDLHSGKIKDESVAATLVPDSENEGGFIGRHMKKLQEKERKKKEAEDEAKRAEQEQTEELSKGSFESLQNAYVDATQNRRIEQKKKKGLLARAERKFLDDEAKQQDDLTLQAISDPQYREELQALALTNNLNQKTREKEKRIKAIQTSMALSQGSKFSGKMLDDESASVVAEALLG